MPTYTQALREAGVAGLVTIELSVDKSGKLTTASVSEGDSRLGDISMQALSKWLWKPYIMNGEPVPVVSTVVFEYKAATGEVLINPALPAGVDIRKALSAGQHR